MPIDVTMPALLPTMEKGTLARWLIAEGDTVRPGDLLAEIETDKATMEVEAVDGGRVVSLVVAAGTDDVPVGTKIALLGAADDGGAPAAATDVERVFAPSHGPAPQPSPPQPPSPLQADRTRIAAPPPEGIAISALARRITQAEGIDLAGISGSGPGGRIRRADLGARSTWTPTEAPAQVSQAAARLPATRPQGTPSEMAKPGSMRRTIARRLVEAKQTIPHFHLTARCRLDALLDLRRAVNADLAPRGIRLSVIDMLMKAMALAMTEVPEVNVQFGDDELHRFARVNIALAVAIDGGLVTPVVRDVASLSLSAIARTAVDLAQRAREGHLTPDEHEGGTASLSNLGMFGIDEMIPIINPPQAMILGVGAGVEMPSKVDDHVSLATIMAATGSFDHRAIDGATAARFLGVFRELVEQPTRILG